jgi:hypothetical protein
MVRSSVFRLPFASGKWKGSSGKLALGQELSNRKIETGNWKLETKVTLKKTHPCGSRDFVVIRMGPEVTLRCTGCGSVVRMGRKAFDKAVQGSKGKVQSD